ncbi:MAG TPA: helix-turn-helix transcriptional regulator, partial [Candidatus Binatia bacterium]|nr:helix-turn-helix transcriptional regulator [Candidatus Binatia bacterium]
MERLSPAERRVAELLLEGRSTRDIAAALTLSEATVRTHLSHIYRKVGARNRVHLLALAARGSRLGPEASPPVPADVGDTAGH